jgi:hypothetical protein
MGTLGIKAQALSVLGLWELGAGNIEAAIAHLQDCRRLAFDLGFLELGHLQWAPELIEALVRRRAASEPFEILEQLTDAAERGERPLISAWAARCRGLIASDADLEMHFLAALNYHRAAVRPFEEARTELCFGERLRRVRRKGEARQHLHAAWRIFRRLGAHTWEAKAAAELAAAGLPLEPGAAQLTGLLTPQELRVALAVTAGASNR